MEDAVDHIFVPGTRVARPHTQHGPLAGLSFVAKDLFDVAGHTPSAGHPAWARSHAAAIHDAPVIASLRAAGADLVGVTIMDELAYSLTGQNIHYGTPDNPRAPGRLCGGSSAGSAAAVAAGVCDFALGTDTGGSVRVPASFCGLFGLRPSHGRVCAQGVVPLAPSFDVVGPMARDGALLSEVSQVLLGSRETPPPLSRMLIAEDAFALLDPDLRHALLDATYALQQQLSVPLDVLTLADEGLARWADVFRRLQAREIWETHGAWIDNEAPDFGPGVKERFAWARETASADAGHADDLALRERVVGRLELLLGSEGTLLVLPPSAGPAPRRHETGSELERFRTHTLPLTCIASLAAIPQLVVPAVSFDDAPVGLSFCAARGQDALLLDLARVLPQLND
jgi:amidase